MKPKVIFIVVTRGFIVRNILRSGVLAYLKAAGHRVIVFFPKNKNEEADSLVWEFTSPTVAVEFLPDDYGLGRVKSFLYRIFKKVVPLLVYSYSTWGYSRIGNVKKQERHIAWAYIERAVYSVLTHFHFLKTVARRLEANFFCKPVYREFFERYKPDLVFSTSIVSKQDIQFLKEAKKMKVKTAAMPKGWDNIAKMLFTVLPDKLILQNEVMKADAVNLQRMPAAQIAVCGFPQFDWYRKTDILLPRADFFKKLGLPPGRRLIFFGSEGTWAPKDHVVAERIASLVNETGRLVKDCSLLVRPHFSDIYSRRFDGLKKMPNVKLDDNYTFSNYFNDNWNPSVEETKFFVNCLYHADVMVTSASTLVLDAACYDKPLIGVAYDILFDRNGKDVSRVLYESDHFAAVLGTSAVKLVYSEPEMIGALNNALTNPAEGREERQKLIQKLCLKVDGQSSKRIADALLEMVS